MLYVVRPPHLKDTILRIGKAKMQELKERGISVKNKLYVETLQDFEQHGLGAYFEGTNGKKFSLKDLDGK